MIYLIIKSYFFIFLAVFFGTTMMVLLGLYLIYKYFYATKSHPPLSSLQKAVMKNIISQTRDNLGHTHECRVYENNINDYLEDDLKESDVSENNSSLKQTISNQVENNIQNIMSINQENKLHDHQYDHKNKGEHKTILQSTITISSHDITAIAGDDVIATQLDLARAYIETGRKQLAKKILEYVISQGSSTQQEDAKQLLNYIVHAV